MRTLFVVRVTAKLAAWQGDWDAEQCLADREKYQSRSVELYEGEDWNEAIATLARAESAEAASAARVRELEQEHGKELGHWQEQIYKMCCAVAVECGEGEEQIDGGGSDGDALLFTLSEIGQAFGMFRARAAALLRENEELRETLRTTAIALHLAHPHPGLTIPPISECQYPHCKAAYALAQPPTGAQPEGDSNGKV